MRISEPIMKRFAQQLGLPSGAAGRFVTRFLNIANRRLIEGSAEALEAARGGQVADIGFGGGYGLDILLDRVGPQGTVYGIDVSATAISQARRRFKHVIHEGQLHLMEAPMRRLPLADDALDGVVTANTIYYIPDDELPASFAEVARTLRTGGRLVVGVGDPAFMAGLPFRDGLRIRPLDEVTGLITNAGFDICDHQRVGQSDRAFHVYAATLQSAPVSRR
ncbi:class I SAM-dependent methyltransferase [Nocardia sp. NPDC051787]|uniref:class I SAM-dependent methyltransferase n=1 Tax=Nocardia sp. NPDC051787 TaxID=3155415 RepID=UPI00344213A3